MARRRVLVLSSLAIAGCGLAAVWLSVGSGPGPDTRSRLGVAGPLEQARSSQSGHSPEKKPAAPEPPQPNSIVFRDITESSGIRFKHNNGAFGKKYLPETMGSGVAVIDLDGDDLVDLVLVNGMDWPGRRRGASRPAFYRNLGGGRFEDATVKAGLSEELYGMGVTAGDYDGDGDVDLYITALGPNRLYRNDGGGSFTDVTKAARVGDPGFGTSATWVDYDHDGDLDLFIANYVKWNEKDDLYCSLDGRNKSYCTPESYEGERCVLYRNDGGGRFSDVSHASGVARPVAKALGVVAFDYDEDGRIDLAVANDTQPNFLFHNKGDGTFEEVGVLTGIAFSEDGVARGAMGIDAADYDGSGRSSLVIGNFSNEMLALYHNEGAGFFIDQAPVSGLGQSTLLTLAFGCFFFDYDLDGWTDIFVSNGHVETDINAVQKWVTYAQPPHLFRNKGDGRFEEITSKLGRKLARPVVARGAAWGDIDSDGDPDLLLSTNNGPAYLYRNEGGERNHWIAFRLQGTKSNRDGFGARLKLTASGRTLQATAKAATSYCSQSQMEVLFGLGAAVKVDRVEIAWPSGRTQKLSGLRADRVVEVVEPE